jgi:cytochrome P450
LVAPDGDDGPGLDVMLAVAAITTTVAALPRAAAWAADADLWHHVPTRLAALADELLRVTAPTPLLPRVAAAPGDLTHPDPGDPPPHDPARLGGPAQTGGPSDRCPVRPGDRLLLVTRHAVDAHRRDPDPLHPAPAPTAQLVFGAGPHACPGARLARTQMADTLAALAPYRPLVVSARVNRRSALPGWRSLVIRAAG